MSAKRNFSPKTAFRVAHNLKLKSGESDYFCLLAQYEAETHPVLKLALQTRLERILAKKRGAASSPRELSLEVFKLISEWYHIPIIEMTELKGFELTPTNIAKRLRITRNEAEVAIERLERLKLIEKKEDGNYRKTNTDYEFRSELMNSALNQFHRQMLGKAVDAIEGQTRQDRLIASNTFSIDPRLLPKAVNLIGKFREQLVELFNSSDENTHTYHLGLQLFRLTEEKVERNKL